MNVELQAIAAAPAFVPPIRQAISLCAYSVACASLHGLLQHHYLLTCRASWLSLFVLDASPYCALVRKGLHVLQWSPVLAAGLAFPKAFQLLAA